MKMKKVFLHTILAAVMLSSLGAWAQTKDNIPLPTSSSNSLTVEKTGINKNLFSQRAELVKKYGVNNAISMGWYTGGVSKYEVRELWSNYILLGNYLSEKLNKLVVLETDKSDREIAIDAYKSMDIVYTSALMGGELEKAGWRPIVGRSEDLVAVVLVREGTVVNKPEDLKKITILGAKGTTVLSFAKYSLIKDGVFKPDELKAGSNNNFKVSDLKQTELLEFLKSKQIEGIIVRETVAKALIKDNPNKFKIVYTAVKAPGHIVFVSKNINLENEKIIQNAFISLTPEIPYYKNILSGLDGYQQNDLKPFKIVNSETLKDAKEVFKIEESKPFVKVTK